MDSFPPFLQNVPGVVECLKIITRNKSLRIADYAFKTAREKGRSRVTAVHKANIMLVSEALHTVYVTRLKYVPFLSWNRKLGDGLFLECCKEVASGYPEIPFDSMIVDNTTMQACLCMFLLCPEPNSKLCGGPLLWDVQDVSQIKDLNILLCHRKL